MTHAAGVGYALGYQMAKEAAGTARYVRMLESMGRRAKASEPTTLTDLAHRLGARQYAKGFISSKPEQKIHGLNPSLLAEAKPMPPEFPEIMRRYLAGGGRNPFVDTVSGRLGPGSK